MDEWDLSKKDPYKVLDIDIDVDSLIEQNCCCCLRPASSVLYKHDDAPEFLRGNPFVVNGYRGMLPFSKCIQSVFTWNNDTINIWSHFIGFFLSFFIMMRDFTLVFERGAEMPRILDRIVLIVGLVCSQFCLLASTGYHIFRCHSPKAYYRWLSLDMTGIVISLLGCYLPGIYFSFYCFTIWRDVYLLVIASMFAAVFYYQMSSRFGSSSWFHARAALSMLLAGCGIIPTCHWIFMNGGFDSEVVQIFLPRILVIYLLALTAFGFYATKFPERFFPGKFDYIGSSHQCWHVIVVAVFLWCYQSGEDLMQYWIDHPCQG